MKGFLKVVWSVLLIASIVFVMLPSSVRAASGRDIISKSGVKGGLVVHIGCGDGRLTGGLRANDSFRVYGLDVDAGDIGKARKYLQNKGLYGPVSVDTFDGKKLPLIDNMVNLVVAEDLGKVSMDEVMRVLAPGGTAYIKKGWKWVATVKRRPDGLDEWTHFQHDPAGTMVGTDEVVGPPRRIQWIGDPKWLRNHEFMSSVHAMVTTNGRVFYIMDEGLRSHIFMPAHWTLIARDAFNGTILWKRDIKDWQTHIWPMKSGPGQMPRRLVAVGDTVYVTLGYNAPVTAINAATGRTIRTYEGTKATEEIIVSDDVLYLLNDPDKEPSNFVEATDNWGKASSRANTGWAWTNESPERFVMAVDGDSGRTLWKYQTSISPQSLTVGPQRIYLYNGDKVVALDKQSGKEAWTSQELKLKPSMTTGYTHRMVYSDGVLAFCHTGSVDAFDAATGKHLWKNKLMGTGHKSPNDMFIVKGLVWSAATGKAQTKGTEIKAIDLHTGEEVKRFTASNLDVYFMHQRCYPGRATEKYLITSGTGTEFYKFDGPETMDLHHYVRGSCIYGIMPANGLLYKPADSCACHYQSKLAFMMALAPKRGSGKVAVNETNRLEKGPAYNKISNIKYKISNRDDWPMLRYDPARSGYTKVAVPADLKLRWRARLGGKLT
ncbi:MAG: PQQ-binding-like beta-propeller repeat protein, partial [Planctomycetes bacterium]|nr:PQQ-binding-like beta-propeller repeat protein [Planctomycetota bacterium]